MDRVINKKRNNNFFFDDQYQNDSTTWRLYDSNDKLIIKGILLDDSFGFSVNHSYGESGLGSNVAGILNTAGKYARILPAASEFVKPQLDKLNSRLGGNSLISSVTDGLDKFNQWTSQDNNALSSFFGENTSFNDAVWGNFVSAIGQIKVFQGTNINLNIPTLKATFFEGDDNGVSTIERIDDLNKTLIGNYEDLEGTLGLLRAPNDYRPDFSNLKPDQASFNGSFTLCLGSLYKITNLVVTNYNAEFSITKHRITGNPLYVDISISVEVASYISRDKLHNCIIKH